MADKFNRLRNADFSEGAKRPRGWSWESDGDAVVAAMVEGDDGSSRDVVLTSDDDEASGFYTQRVRCKPEHWYRIEAVVTCACDGEKVDAGAMLCVNPQIGGDSSDRVRLAVVSRTVGPETLRGYYRTPADAKSFQIGVGISGTTGEVRVHSALVIPNIEPEVTSNPLALPPPPYAYPPPRRVRRVCVCDESGEHRPFVSMLRARFRRATVEHVRTKSIRVDKLSADALIIAGSRPPVGMRSLRALERAGANRLVIISLEAFFKVAPEGLRLRDVEQPDDPIHAKIVWANFMTRGFALHDAFPWSSPAEDRRVFRQRHLRRGAAMNRLRKDHGYETVLSSLTDSDATSGHPICLHKAIDGGGVIVFDADAVDTMPTTCDETGLAAFLLLNMLGADQASLGQFTAPVDTEKEWYDLLKEFAQRYRAARLSGTSRHDMVVEIGASEETFGLPMRPRPAILIRSGLRGDDVAGMYGCLAFVKQLLRGEPYENPYARSLLSAFRLAWIPLCGPYHPNDQEDVDAVGADAMTGSFEPGSIAAVIDVTDGSRHSLRVTYGREDAASARHARLLPELAKCFGAGRYVYRSPEPGSPIARRDGMAWRRESMIPDVSVDPDAFATEFHVGAAAAGANLVRIELPGSCREFTCHSIWRTDLAATTLEHVLGLHFGLIAVNRSLKRVLFGDHAPLGTGEAIVDHEDGVVNKQVG